MKSEHTVAVAMVVNGSGKTSTLEYLCDRCLDMVIFAVLILGLVTMLIVSACADFGGPGQSARDEAGAAAEFTSFLDIELPKLMERYDVPGLVITIVRQGRPVWSGAYGYADRGKQRPMTTDTVVRAESISKSVTAWGVMQLIEAGELSLDTPVVQFVPEDLFRDSRFDPQSITVEMLLSNSSGLPLGTIGPSTEYPPGSETPSIVEFVSKDAQVASAPGSEFNYSNIGFNLLEVVIQEASGEEFSDYMRDRVLLPLGMQQSDFAWRSSYTDTIATGYELGGDPVGPYIYPAAASGGLFSTVEDLARFVAASVASDDATILPLASITALHMPRIEIPGLFGFVADSYAHGHFVETLPDGRRAVWHGGQGHGWMTHFHAVPESGDGIVVVTNSQRSWPLMAELLAGWSRWSGLGAVKFARVVHAGTVARLLLATLLAAVAVQVIRLTRGIKTGRRRWSPSLRGPKALRALQALSGIGLAGLLIWRATLPYTFESSIFPTLVGWAAITLGALSAVLVMSAAFPD